MSITVNDCILRMQDYLGNYSTGQINTSMQIRAVDSAVNYLKNLLSFPFDEKKTTFLYSSDNFYYSCPSDFQEAIGLFYDSAKNNFPQQGSRWEYRPYEELLVRLGQYPATSNMWSHTTINGTNQLILLGTNQMGGQVLETFDSTLWTASGDASAATTDTQTYYQGTASERFTITYSTGAATLTSPTVFWNFTSLVQKQGWINLYAYFPSTAVTSVTFKFQSSAGNSYSITVTAQADGTAWQVNTWNKLAFQIANATITGTPNLSSINQLSVTFNVPNTFGTVANFRIDDLYTTFPDLMDFIYLSNIKGTDASGSSKSVLTLTTDTLPYSNDFVEPIGLQAAIYAYPQLRGQPEFFQMYKMIFMDFVKTYARRWPKKRRENNFLRTRLGR